MYMQSKKILVFIIANEFCERFCYYGFRTILFTFLRESYFFSENKATRIVHLFNFSCFLFTLFGGFLSDALIGRYMTILILSMVYFAGTVLTTLSSVFLNFKLLALGLFLISIGTGGIKPCVSTFGGDQFLKNDTKGMQRFFSVFYFAINSGSLLSIFLTPILAKVDCLNSKSCYPFAFTVPSLLLGTSLILFLSGRKQYVRVKPNYNFFMKFCKSIFIYIKYLKNDFFRSKKNENNFSDALFRPEDNANNKIRQIYGSNFAKELKCAFNICKTFLLIPFFWMLYDQQATTWVEQSSKMNSRINLFFFSTNIIPAQMQAINGILILIFIPLFTKIIYPYCNKKGLDLCYLKKMCLGMFFASLSFFVSALIENYLNSNYHILWQIPQYVLLTIGEVLLSLTGLEFVYSQSPKNLKGILLSAWLIAVAFGNLFVILLTSIDIFVWLKIKNASVLNFVVYGIIGLVATFYFYKNSMTFTYKNSKEEKVSKKRLIKKMKLDTF
ncbi:hypothetical protein GVAV_001379 [Gurleya vavrai]